MREPWLIGHDVAAVAMEAYISDGGGRAIEVARRASADDVIASLEESGLRGRGGAGFPTGIKWRTVAANRSADVKTTVVVNAAEGEPGCFKDRAILRVNPYQVLEGAVVAATVLGADTVVVATKATFADEIARLRDTVAEARGAGWLDGLELFIVEGPEEYLFGEETGLLEVIAGRPPFPRIAPPFRHGVEGSATTGEAAAVPMAPGGEAPPTLVNNVETFANVPGIVTEGPGWFRSTGTPESPGTVVCTVTGAAERHGIGEFPMGTPLRHILDTVGGPGTSEHAVAVLSGVANPLLPAIKLDAPVSYEGMEAAGSGLGAAGFIVFDRDDDLAAVAHGVARFLAVESCGQCTPCKGDGLAIAGALERIRSSAAEPEDLALVVERVATVADEARCYLAQQHQRVLDSILRLFPDSLRHHVDATAAAVDSYLVAPIVGFEGDRAILDTKHAAKQPDWTYDETDSGQWPAARLDVERSTGDGSFAGAGEDRPAAQAKNADTT